MGHTGAYIINSFFTGSSPPMLGIPLSAPGGDLSKWFIPTYVGHTDQVHGHRGVVWFIPTYVGHTRAVNPVNIYCPVHPHIRGAYRKSCKNPLFQLGSSPHTWGIHMDPCAGVLQLRFIPTYVGHTRVKNLLISPRTVHPHLRGAYMGRPAKIYVKNGSSPHTWGIRLVQSWVRPSLSVHPHIRGAYV